MALALNARRYLLRCEHMPHSHEPGRSSSARGLHDLEATQRVGSRPVRVLRRAVDAGVPVRDLHVLLDAGGASGEAETFRCS